MRRSIAATNAVILVCVAGSLAIAVVGAHLLKIAPHSLVTGGVGNGPLPYLSISLLGAGAYLNWERLGALFVGRFPLWFAAYLLIEFVSAGFGACGVDFVHLSALCVLKMVFLAGSVLALAHSHVGLARVLRGNDLPADFITITCPCSRPSADWAWSGATVCGASASAARFCLPPCRGSWSSAGSSA